VVELCQLGHCGRKVFLCEGLLLCRACNKAEAKAEPSMPGPASGNTDRGRCRLLLLRLLLQC
jgi:hypothetical protein